MKIVIISPAIYPCVSGGVEIFNYHFVKTLADLGNKICIITDCDYNFKYPENIEIRKITKILPIRLFSSIQVLLNLFRFRKSDYIHVPYTSNSYVIYPVLIINLLFRTKYIIYIHGGGMHPWRFPIIYNLFFNYAHTVIAISDIIKIEYEKRTGRPVLLIPPVLPFKRSDVPKNLLKRKYDFQISDKIIMSIGTLKRIKCPNILLDAFLRLGKDYIDKNNLKLLFVGDGELKAELIDRVKKEKMSDFILFFGIMPHEVIPEMYKIADIYVIPSLFEGTPISLLEAMFNELPIIGSDTQGINNIINDCLDGLLFKKEDSEDLKNKIKRLVEDEQFSTKLAKNAKKMQIANFNFKIVIKKHLEIMRD